MKHVDIISGFLGAGKTTLIKKILSSIDNNSHIAIIENEYGEVGIDGNILKSQNLNIKEVTSGCICCSIENDFKLAMEEIIKTYSPDRIIIEPSGVAKLQQVIKDVKETIKNKGYDINMIITVVDAINFESYLDNFGEFFVSQISFAKTVVLSKTDFIKNNDTLQVFKGVRKINPNCPIISTPIGKLDGKKIIDVAEFKNDEIFDRHSSEIKRSVNVVGLMRHSHECHCADEVFDSWGVETPKKFTVKEITDDMNELIKGKYGNVLRAKGIVNTDKSWIQFDFVSGKTDVKKIEYDYTGRICVIGTQLKKKEISNLFIGE